MSESSGLVLSSVKAAFVWSAWAAAFVRCELGCDHAPWDRLAAWQLPGPRRGPRQRRRTSGHGYPSRRYGRRRRRNCHRSSGFTMPATAARWGRAPASRRAAINTSAGVRMLTTTAWARAALDYHRDGHAVARRAGSPQSAARRLAPRFRRLVPPPGRESRSRRALTVIAVAALSQPDTRCRERVLAVDLDQLVPCSRARDDRHLRRRDVGPPRHGPDHRCVSPPVGRRLADPQLQRRAVPLQPLGASPRVNAHGDPRPPAHQVLAAACRRVRNVIDHRSWVTGGIWCCHCDRAGPDRT